jgi:hypothetical protein
MVSGEKELTDQEKEILPKIIKEAQDLHRKQMKSIDDDRRFTNLVLFIGSLIVLAWVVGQIVRH